MVEEELAELISLSCCAVKEIADIGRDKTAERTLLSITRRRYTYLMQMEYAPPSCAYLLFTSVGKGRYGTRLAKYVVDNGLGTIDFKSTPTMNPNSHNMVTVWLWTINREGFRKWCDVRNALITPAKVEKVQDGTEPAI